MLKPGTGIWFCLVFFCLALGACQLTEQRQEPRKHFSFLGESFSKEGLAVQRSLSRTTMSVADQTVLILTSTAPEEYSIEFPSFEEQIGDFSIVYSRPLSQELVDGFLQQTVSYTLAPFLSGSYMLPEMTIVANKADSKEDGLQVVIPEIEIIVTSLLTDDNRDPADIAPVTAVPPNYFFYWLMAGLALVVCLAFALYWFKIRKPFATPPPPPVPSHIAAAQALDALLSQNLPAQGLYKKFYGRLSHILRLYIENRFHLKAVEQTSEEFFKNPGLFSFFSAEQNVLLKRFLSHCDLVKFARHSPSQVEIENSSLFCRQFFEKTRPEERKTP